MNATVSVTEYKNNTFPLWLASTDHGICRISFAASQTFNSFKHYFHSSKVQSSPHLEQLKSELDNYFSGSLETFQTAIDLNSGTLFQNLVWEALCTIPYGSVRTYGQIARQINHSRAARAVGNANSANPLPVIVPCHRVIAAKNKIGGYGAGIHIKRSLLQLEGYHI